MFNKNSSPAVKGCPSIALLAILRKAASHLSDNVGKLEICCSATRNADGIAGHQVGFELELEYYTDKNANREVLKHEQYVV
jgi:hypothetical protein